MEPKDRRTDVLLSPTLNGIDFVEVANDAETLLRVHFLNAVKPRGSISATITGGERIPSVTVGSISDADWSLDDSHLVLTLSVVAPGDFSNYTLAHQKHARGQPAGLLFFAERLLVQGAVQLGTRLPSRDHDLPSPRRQPPADRLSRQGLPLVSPGPSRLLGIRYPDWQERLRGRFRGDVPRSISGLADDLSYTQDRIAAEASLETATQRRSVVHHARLVDYEPSPATSATVLLQFNVDDATSSITDGTMVSASGPDGSADCFRDRRKPREPSRRFHDGDVANLDQIPSTMVSSAWNHGVIQPYWFDDSDRCLRPGRRRCTSWGPALTSSTTSCS